jgi:hypothetical protein
MSSGRTCRASWSYAPRSARNRREYLRSFFRFCHDAGWIARNPALAVRGSKVEQTPTLPFDDDFDLLSDLAATASGVLVGRGPVSVKDPQSGDADREPIVVCIRRGVGSGGEQILALQRGQRTALLRVHRAHNPSPAVSEHERPDQHAGKNNLDSRPDNGALHQSSSPVP